MMIKQHSCLSPFEKRAMDRELRQIGLTGNMANAAVRVASRHLDVALQSRRIEWARMVTAISYANHLGESPEVEG